jgi:hypothetical protein
MKVLFLILILSFSVLSQNVLTNKDIVELTEAGISEAIIIAKINNSQFQFDTSMESLKALNKSKVASAVIVLMIEKMDAKHAAANEKGYLGFEAAIVYNYGGAQALARTDVMLLDKSVTDSLQEWNLTGQGKLDLMTTLGFALLYPSEYKAFSELAADALKKHLVKATITDFNGKGEFTDLKPGDYWIFCFTKTRGGFAI